MIRITCKEVSTAAATGSLEGAALLLRLRVRLHLLICRYCRRFLRQLRLIRGAMATSVFPAPAPERVQALERAALERLRRL